MREYSNSIIIFIITVIIIIVVNADPDLLGSDIQRQKFRWSTASTSQNRNTSTNPGE